MKNPYFQYFSPLVAVEHIKNFKNLFDFVKAHIKRQLYFAIRWHASNFYFFAQALTAPYYTCLLLSEGEFRLMARTCMHRTGNSMFKFVNLNSGFWKMCNLFYITNTFKLLYL